MAHPIDALAAAVASAASQTSITAVGSLERAKRDGPPRITWMPVDGDIGPPEQDEDNQSKSAYQEKLMCSVFFLGSSREEAGTLKSTFLKWFFRTQSQISARPKKTRYPQDYLSSSKRYEIEMTVEVDVPELWDTYTPVEVEQVEQNTTITP